MWIVQRVVCYRVHFTFTFTLLALYLNSVADLFRIYLFCLLGVHESVHCDTTTKITSKMHYIV